MEMTPVPYSLLSIFTMDETEDFSAEWASLCREVRDVHREMAQFLDERFQRIFAGETAKYAELSAPQSLQEMKLRRFQRAALSGRIAALSQAGAFAKFQPPAAAAIADEAERWVNRPLPEHQDQLPDHHQGLLDFCNRIAELARHRPG
jgi:hypothetical protein